MIDTGHVKVAMITVLANKALGGITRSCFRKETESEKVRGKGIEVCKKRAGRYCRRMKVYRSLILNHVTGSPVLRHTPDMHFNTQDSGTSPLGERKSTKAINVSVCGRRGSEVFFSKTRTQPSVRDIEK